MLLKELFRQVEVRLRRRGVACLCCTGGAIVEIGQERQLACESVGRQRRYRDFVARELAVVEACLLVAGDGVRLARRNGACVLDAPIHDARVPDTTFRPGNMVSARRDEEAIVEALLQIRRCLDACEPIVSHGGGDAIEVGDDGGAGDIEQRFCNCFVDGAHAAGCLACDSEGLGIDAHDATFRLGGGALRSARTALNKGRQIGKGPSFAIGSCGSHGTEPRGSGEPRGGGWANYPRATGIAAMTIR